MSIVVLHKSRYRHWHDLINRDLFLIPLRYTRDLDGARLWDRRKVNIRLLEVRRSRAPIVVSYRVPVAEIGHGVACELVEISILEIFPARVLECVCLIQGISRPVG